MKKWGILGSILVLIALIALGGCSGADSGGADGGTGTTGEPAASKLTAPGQLPITTEKETLKILIKGNPSIEDYNTNEFTQWLEEKTNIDLQFEIVPEKSALEKLNLVLSSGDYPDVIMGFTVTPTQMMIYGNQGIFQPLNDLIEKYGVETKKVFQEMPVAKELITAPDGNIYAMPQINECYHCTMHQRMWIYKPWLDKLGLKMPTTTDEFYEVLKAFRDRDPNGNGQKDEIPLSGSPQNAHTSIDSFLMNAFIYNHGANKLYLSSGKVDVPYNKPEWKEGLKYLHKLYAEGLIAPQTFTQDQNQLRQMGENPLPILGASSGHNMGSVSQLAGQSGRWLEYVAVPPLKGPGGVQLAALHPFAVNNGEYIITKNAKNPDLAFRLADYMYNTEVTLRWYAGREGVEWKWAEKGEIGINGKQAVWKQVTPWGGVQNVNYGQRGTGYRPNDFRLGEVMNPEQPLEPLLYNETKQKMEPYKQKMEAIFPPVFFTAEQAAEIADLEKTILDHMKEMVARFITGDADIDKDWDGYVKNLENMNLKRYLQLNQEAYDAKYKK